MGIRSHFGIVRAAHQTARPQSICQQAQENGFSLFTYISTRIEKKLTLNGMDLNLPESCKHLRLTLKLPLADALRIHNVARAKRLSASD